LLRADALPFFAFIRVPPPFQFQLPAVSRSAAAEQFAEKAVFLGGRIFSSDNKSLAFAGLQRPRKRFKEFFLKRGSRVISAP
jgi:hypothetical protein